MVTFLRWWFIVCFSAFGLVVAAGFGFFPYLWQSDATKLSFVALTLFVGTSAFIGLLTYSAIDGDQLFAKHLSMCWYLAEMLLGIGMIGTLIGFLILLQGAFGGQLDLTNAESAQKVLSGMAVGFATAGLTTLVGLTTSLILKLQLINLEYQLADE